MWRQTLRVIPTFRGGNNVKVQTYGQLMTHIQSQQPLNHDYVNGSINDLIKKKKGQSDDETVDYKNIELVPSNIQKYLFPNISQEEIDARTDELFDMIELPELHPSVHEKGLMAHFDAIGKEQFDEYEQLLLEAMRIEKPPKMPSEWKFQVGWTRYDPETNETVAVEYPDDRVLFFDVEVCVQDGPLACLAVAMSPKYWYSWCSDRLINDTDFPKFTKLDHLVPLEEKGGTTKPKIVIGHNVGFDRARVREQYFSEVCFFELKIER